MSEEPWKDRAEAAERRIKQLEKGYDELRTIMRRQKNRADVADQALADFIAVFEWKPPKGKP